jgi:hypothetical protein
MHCAAARQQQRYTARTGIQAVLHLHLAVLTALYATSQCSAMHWPHTSALRILLFTLCTRVWLCLDCDQVPARNGGLVQLCICCDHARTLTPLCKHVQPS